MRLAYDVTSLHDRRTGVGAFAGEVLDRIASFHDVDVIGFSVSWRGRDRVRDELVPPGVDIATRPMAAQPLRRLWRRVDWPPIEWWTGRIDLVHGPNFVVPPSRAAVELVTVHDLTFVRHPEMSTRDTLQYPDLIRRAVRRGAHVHTVSAFVAGEVIDEFGVAADHVHVVANGVDTVVAGDARAGAAIAGGERYVLAMGTIEPRKDFPSLVRAFDVLATTDTDVRLVIAGQDGWGTAALHDALSTARHRDRVVRPGFVDAKQRADLLAGARVFAYPSRYEGFGLAPLEAMATGTPVVTTRTGALPEVLGDAASFVEAGDAPALTNALGTLLDDSAARTALVERGLARAGRYSWDACAAGLAELYRRLC